MLQPRRAVQPREVSHSVPRDWAVASMVAMATRVAVNWDALLGWPESVPRLMPRELHCWSAGLKTSARRWWTAVPLVQRYRWVCAMCLNWPIRLSFHQCRRCTVIDSLVLHDCWKHQRGRCQQSTAEHECRHAQVAPKGASVWSAKVLRRRICFDTAPLPY